MIEDTLTVRNPAGLHARSARNLVETASDFEAEIILENAEVQASADSILEVMMLAAHAGSQVTVTIEGPDEEKAHEELVDLFESGFYENDPTV